MPNQNSPPADDLRPTPGAFAEPQTLGQFNDRLRVYRIALSVSAAQYEYLCNTKGRKRLVDALRSLHAGGTNRRNARTFLISAIEEARREAQNAPSQGSGQSGAPAGEAMPSQISAAFTEPTTLGELNAMLRSIDPALALSAEENKELVGAVGRTEVMSYLVLALGNTADRDYGIQQLRARIADAKVRVARASRSAPTPPEDHIPGDEGEDGGFSGIAPQEPERRFDSRSQQRDHRAPSQAPTRPAAQQSNRSGGESRPERHQASAPRESQGAADGFAAKAQARAYGKAAALCMEETVTSRDEVTVCVEMAPADPKVDKKYEWKDKVRFHLMRKELLMLLAVLYRMAPGVQFKNHGPTKSKWLKIENQPGKVYLSMGDKDIRTLGIPISEPDAIADMAVIVLQVACKSFHGVEPQALLGLVRASVAPDIRV